MPSSHRRLVHRHAERLLTGKGRELAPGEARIFSYYAPSLDGGPHNVSISQSISAPAEAGSAKEAPRRLVKLEAPSQSFIVATPRFSLAPGIIDSVYPTPGISVDHTILPHIVFRDPDLPWSRSPSPAHIPEDEDKGNLRSPSTWLALLVFSLDELQLNQSQIKHVFQNMPPDVKHEQSETCTLRTLARHTPLLNGIENLVNTTGFKERDDAKDAAEPTELIMVPGKLFNGLFVAPDGPRDKLDVACYQHMAHVRQVATDGMVNAGVDSDEAIFSAVVSRRTGLIDVDTPSTMIAHLISLSWDDEMPFPKDEDRVAMVSLHSWTYTCLPSKNKANTSDMLANLGDHLTVLRTDDAWKDTPPPSKGEEKDLEALIAARQRDGYTLTRHHTVTGEVTAALLRGPLTPVQVPRPLKNSILMLSNFGTDLAILDPRLSLMDITYSSAWQLGKSLAMADGAFCAALARLRNAVQGGGLNAAKPDVHALFDGDGYGTRQRAAGRMADLFRGLNQMNTSPDTRGVDATAVSTNRWSYDDDAHEDEPGVRTQPVDMLSQSTPHIASRLPAQLDAAALRLAMAIQLDTKDEGEDTGVTMYNEHNTPVSPDYALIYSWVLDKVHLGDIPAQYLIPDPAFLPEETLRFFHIDANWVDALIDGALSLANHWGDNQEKDLSRASIKKAINKRLRTADKSLGGWHVQMPRYGLLLRSQLLVQFPDLAVDVKFSDTRSQPIDSEGVKIGTGVTPPANTPAQQPILVQKRIAPDTMYVLFDAAPPDLQRITFTVPPHQQCFRVGHSLTADSLQFILRKNYTTKERPPDQKRGEGLGNRVFNFDGTPTAVFSWQTRTLDPTAFGQYLVDELSAGMKGYFDGQEPTSAVLALQLNEDILQLDIGDESFVPLIARSRVTPGFNHRQDEDSPTRGAVLLAEYRQLPKNLAPPSPARGPLVTSPLGFSLRIYPVRGATREFVSSTTGLLVDLIFSLTRPIKGRWPKWLTRIFVADSNPEVDTPLLAQGADPAPAC